LYGIENEEVMKNTFLLVGCLSVVLWSCKNEPEQPVVTTADVNVSFNALWDDQPFVMQQVYMDDFGNRLRADKLMNYLAFVTLVAEDGTETQLKDFMLLDFSENNEISATLPKGKYTQLKFGVGVPRDYNKDQDPAQYPSSHALSVAGSQGMFWVWNTGYIFAKFEGKCDTTGTAGAELLTPIAIHAGDEISYREFVSAPFVLDLTSGAKSIRVNLHIDEIFSPVNGNDVDLAQDAITHTSTNPELAADFMDNYIAALTVDL
jgi:hypothetical protein